MSDVAIADCTIYSRKEAADYLRRRWFRNVSPQYLAKLASKSEGPKYQKTAERGGGTVYHKDDLDIWAATRLRPGKVK